MNFFNKIKRMICILLVTVLAIPSNLPVLVQADEQEEKIVAENNNGFTLTLDWDDSEFKDGSAYNIIENTNTSNAVKLKVSYSNEKVSESGYKAGELIITVKGIGAVNRSGNIEASVGADKASSATKSRDWSYTYNKATDTYTFTNNNEIKPNSVLSGYFDMVWNLSARNTIHGYSQDDIQAQLLLPDGDSVDSNVLTFSNNTTCDEYQVGIERSTLYSSNGVEGSLESPDGYTFIKYNLSSYLSKKSRGVKESETFIFDPDVTGVGTYCTLTYSPLKYTELNDGTYQVVLENNTVSDQYVVVAYLKDEYVGNTVKASITSYGSFYEGDNSGNTDKVQLAKASIEFNMPADFDFKDTNGDIHDIKVSEYEYKMSTDSSFKDEVIKNGGHIAGSKMKSSNIQSFYLGVCKERYGEDGIADIDLIDDFIYIAQNDGNYRQLTSKDFNIESVDILSTNGIRNENGLPVQSDKYIVRVYAVQNDAIYTQDESTLVWEGLWRNYEQSIDLPENTTAVGVVFKDIEESLYLGWDCSTDTLKEPMVRVNINFHLDEEGLEEHEKANLTDGQLVNLLNTGQAASGEDSYLDSDINIDLAQKDLEIYGKYIDRDKGTITFFGAEKSDYKSVTELSKISVSGSKYTSVMTMGAEFNYKEDETPDKFSLYTILPEKVSLDGYEVEEDIWNIMSLSGMGLSSDTLADRCTPEIVEDYNGSGRTYIALHFDFEGLDVPQESEISAKFTIKTVKNYFRDFKSTVNVRSAVIIDEDLNESLVGKVCDDGSWDSDFELSKDIDNDENETEYLAYSYDYVSFTYVDSSELQMTKSVKASSVNDYVQLPEIPMAELGSDYSYEITIKNGNSASKNIVVLDVLESGSNSEWKGTFSSVDLSEAEKLGLTGTVWYSDKEEPGEVGGSDWSTHSEDFSEIKAIAVDFGESELKSGGELNIYIHMIAPEDESLKGKITENGFSASFTMIDAVSGNETDSGLLESNFVQVKLTAKLKNIIVTKVDEESNERLSGAEYSLINKDTNEVIATSTTNSRGQIIFRDIPSDVTYVLRENAAPIGYEIGEDYEITFGDEDTYRVTLKDKRKTASAVLIKSNVGDTYVKVMGAEYTLFTADGTEVQKAETNINGKITFENISWGTYYIQETKAPDGYALDETKHELVITKENVEEVQEFRVKDDQVGTTRVKLTKYAMTTTGVQTDIVLSGAAFELVRTTEGQNYSVGTYVTDKNGEIIIEDLTYGDYKFRESRIPAGYEKTNDVEFSISPEKQEAELIAYDKRKSGSVNVFKKDNLDNIVIGAVFELYDETKNNVLGTYTTDDTGSFSINNLEWGTYYLREKSTLECYQLSQDWVEIEIGAKTLDVDLTLVNETKKGTVILTKTDEIGKNVLEGAEFNLYDGEGTLLQEGLVTDENGQIRVENLEWGKYYFKETKAPVGYGLTDETIRFAVNSLNAGIEQAIQVTNPLESKVITVTKKIKADDINFANGDPTFLFKLEGTDVNGSEHTYYRILKFDENYVNAHIDEDGFVSQSVTFSGFVAGSYVASEEECGRYSLDDITGLSENAELNGELVTFDMSSANEGSVTFVNGKYENASFSDSGSAANSLKVQAKLTGLKVNWLEDSNVKANVEIDRNSVEVTALYDDGSSRVLSSNEWSFGDSFSGITFPNLNGEYQIPITYTENGITRNSYFEVTISGAFKEKIIRLEAAVKEDYQSVSPNCVLSSDMFDVVAVYNDGSRVKLMSSSYPIITSPNYPSNYPNNMTESENYWEETIEGASSIKVVFDSTSKTQSATTDYVQVYDNTGTNVSGKLGGTTIAGSEVIVSGNYVKITMVSNSYSTFKGFSATLIPLDEDGNELPLNAYTIDKTNSPVDEGIFGVNISLNPDVSVENVSTTVNMLVVYNDPILLKGGSFYGKIPSTATSVVFTDEVSPSGVSVVDLSAEENNSVVGWLDGTTFKVSTQRKGVKVIANEDSSKLFYDKTSLTSIDVTYLDTSSVTNMNDMFSGCKGLNSLDLSSFNTSNVTSMYNMFFNCQKIVALDLKNFNTSNVTTMRDMFRYCYKFTSLDLSSFDTSNVTDMNGMFDRCSGLTSLDLGSFDTSKVTYMGGMFLGCRSLTSLDLSSFNTSSVTNMPSMFSDCSGLTSLDLSSFDTSSVTNMQYMFSGCSGLTSLDLSSFNTSKVTYMESMFSNCNSLITLNLSSFDTSKVGNNTDDMFSGSKGLSEIILGEKCNSVDNELPWVYWYDADTNEVYRREDIPDNVAATYRRCTSGYPYILLSGPDFNEVIPSTATSVVFTDTVAPSIAKLTDVSITGDGTVVAWLSGTTYYVSTQVSGVKIIADEDMSSAFSGKTKINNIDFSNFDTSNVTDMSGMFGGYLALTSLDLSSFDTSNVTDMSGMFGCCYLLTTLDLSGFDTSKVTDMSGMFTDCRSLTSLDLSSFDTSNVTDMEGIFSDCSGLTTLNISSFDTSNVTTMKEMFSDCSGLSALDLSSFNTSSVTNMSYMFRNCSSIITLDLCSFDTSKVTNMNYMFNGCKLLKTIYVSDLWNVNKVSTALAMFTNCSSIVGQSGTTYSSSKVTKTMANYSKGYLTYKAQ